MSEKSAFSLLNPSLVENLKKINITEPTPVQNTVIPKILNITLYRNSRFWKIYISKIISKRISAVKMFYFNLIQEQEKLLLLPFR